MQLSTKDTRYFTMYNIFNSLKHAIDLSIIQSVSDVTISDSKLVNKTRFTLLTLFVFIHFKSVDFSS